MFFEPRPGVKVNVTVITPVVVGRVAEVLVVLILVLEVASAAVNHGVLTRDLICSDLKGVAAKLGILVLQMVDTSRA